MKVRTFTFDSQKNQIVTKSGIEISQQLNKLKERGFTNCEEAQVIEAVISHMKESNVSKQESKNKAKKEKNGKNKKLP